MDGGDKNRENGEESKEVMMEKEDSERKWNDDVVVEINDGERSKSKALCRICHFVDDETSGDSQLIAIGCDCRGDLGVSHRGCAALWFSHKGNRMCEICGKTAENIVVNSYMKREMMNSNENENDNNPSFQESQKTVFYILMIPLTVWFLLSIVKFWT